MNVKHFSLSLCLSITWINTGRQCSDLFYGSCLFKSESIFLPFIFAGWNVYNAIWLYCVWIYSWMAKTTQLCIVAVYTDTIRVRWLIFSMLWKIDCSNSLQAAEMYNIGEYVHLDWRLGFLKLTPEISSSFFLPKKICTYKEMLTQIQMIDNIYVCQQQPKRTKYTQI